MDNQKSNQDRLEDALLTFIERTVQNESADPHEISVLPAMGEVLVKLWGHH